MKKVLLFLLPLLAATMLTACGNSDEPVNKQIVSMVTNNRAIEGDAVQFSQGNAKVELNYTDMIIQFTGDYKDASGTSRSLTTPAMKMTNNGGTVYRFDNATSSTYTGIGILTGYIDLSTGMMWCSFDEGSSHVVMTTQLLYAYSSTQITNPDNGNTGNHNKSAYLFALDSRGETCIMKITNFITNLNGSGTADVYEIQYNGLTVTPTTTGYIITSDKAESSLSGFYTISDLNFKLDDQCRVIDGSFKCSGLEFKVTGDLFPIAN